MGVVFNLGLLVFIPAVALAWASAIQGLRVTWAKSRWKASLIVAFAIVALGTATFSHTPRSTAEMAGNWGEVGTALVWPLSSYAASVAARRKSNKTPEISVEQLKPEGRPTSQPTLLEEAVEEETPRSGSPFE
jgi:hypothetical protein